MPHLSQADLELLLNAARTLGEQRTLDAFPDTAMRIVKSLIPAISYSYTEVDLNRKRSTGSMDPSDIMPPPSLVTVWDSYVHQHPLVTRDARRPRANAELISDYLDERTYHGMGLYADFYRLLDTEDQIALQLQFRPQHTIGIVVNRDRRTFSERDRSVLNAIHDHVLHSYRNADLLSLLTQESSAGSPRAIWLTASGAQPLIDAYVGSDRVPGTGLPELLLDWIRAQREWRRREEISVFLPLRIPGPTGVLTVRFLAGPSGAYDLLLLNEQRLPPLEDALASLGLSPRQTEVVRWVVQGKTSAEIGSLMGVTTRTVEKHLESIYARLNVDNRSTLVARAIAVERSLTDRQTSESSPRESRS